MTIRRKSLILLLSIAMVVCLSFFAMVVTPIKAFAQSVVANNFSLFTADSKASTSVSGIEVDTTKNTGEIAGIFSGNFEMEFCFSAAGYGSTEVAFYDKDDVTTKLFSVVYALKDGNVGSALVFDYRDNTYHAFSENGNISSIDQWTVDRYSVNRKNEVYPNTFRNSTVGKLGVYFSGDNISIKVSEGWNNAVSTNVELATVNCAGLADGYIVKLEKNSLYNYISRTEGYDSVVVKTINGVDFTSDEIVDFTMNGQISYNGEIVQGDKYIIELSKAQELLSFDFVGSVEINFANANLGKLVNPNAKISFNIDETFDDKDVGSYDLIVSFEDIQKAYTVIIKDGDTCSPIELFSVDSEVEKMESGVRVNNMSSSAMINSILKDDFELEFSFTKAGFYTNEIAFYSKTDLNNKVFSVVYTVKDNNVGSALVFDYRDNTYHAFGESGGVATINQWTVDRFNIVYKNEVYPNSYDGGVVGKLGAYFDGDNVSIKVVEGWNGEIKNYVKLAELSVPSLVDGYVVKIEKNSLYSNLARTVGTDKLLIHSINGLSCAKEKLACTIYEDSISHDEEYVIEDSSVIDIIVGTPVGKFNYVKKFKIDCSGKGFVDFDCMGAITKFDIPTKYQTKSVGEYKETVSYNGIEKDYLIRVKNGKLIETKEIFAGNQGVSYINNSNNSGYAVNTKTHDLVIGEYLHDNLEIEYAYTQNGYGATEFVFYDKDAPTVKVFSVLKTFNYNNNGTAFVVDYVKNKVVALNVESDFSAIDPWYPWGVANGDDKIEIYPNNAGLYSTVGKLGLFFDGDKVNIKVSQGWDGEITNYLTLATLTIPNFSDGYILKLEGSTLFREKGDDSIIITSINGIDFSRDNVPGQIVGSSIVHQNEYKQNGKTYINIPLGSNVPAFTFINDVDVSGVVVSVVDAPFEIGKTFSDKKVGEYNLTVNQKGVSKDYVIKVLPAYQSTQIFSSNSKAALVSAGGNTGVRVTPYRQEATFNGQFYEDLEIEYAYEYSSYGTVRFDFYDKDDSNKIVFSIYRSYGIGRPDKTSQGIVETTWGSAFVEYNGKFYALGKEFTTAKDAIIYCQDQNLSFYPVNNAKASDPYCNFTDKWNIPGKLILTWTENDVAIQATTGEGNTITGISTLATLNLPNFKDGYTIKLTGQGFDSTHVSDEGIIILGVNGTKFDNEYADCSFYSDEMRYSSFMSADGKIYVAQNGELGAFSCAKNYEYYALRWQKSLISDEDFVKAGFRVEYDVDLTTPGEKQVAVTPYLYGESGKVQIYTVIVEESAKVTFDCNGGDELPVLYYSEHTFNVELPIATKQGWKFGGWYKGSELFEGFNSFESLTDISLKAHWYDDVAPELNFVDQDTEVIKITTEIQSLTLSSADVFAYDKATNKVFADEEIVISVKAPNSDEYVELSSFVFNNKLYGTYFVKYSVTDNWVAVGDTINNQNYTSNNVGELIRVISYAAEKPVITLDTEVAKVAYVGMNLSIPDAVAKSGDKVIETVVSLTVGNKYGVIVQIDINDNLKYEIEGTYKLVYYAKDECGQATMETFEIVCKKDLNKPTIQVEFDNATARVGETLIIPTAKAIDEEFGAVDVTVEVLLNNEIVSTEESITFNQEGLYIIRYVAKDGAGNIAIQEFSVIAVNTQGQGCASWVDGGVTIFSLILLASTLWIFKNNKNKGGKENEKTI